MKYDVVICDNILSDSLVTGMTQNNVEFKTSIKNKHKKDPLAKPENVTGWRIWNVSYNFESTESEGQSNITGKSHFNTSKIDVLDTRLGND